MNFAVGDRVQVKTEHDPDLPISKVPAPLGEIVNIVGSIADVRHDDGNHSPYPLEHLEPA
jgi:hypothetical protein